MRLSPIDASLSRLINFGQSSNSENDPGNPRLVALGMLTGCVGTMYDTTANVANWGNAEVMSVSSVGASAILPGTLVTIDKNFRIAPTLASMANTGSPVFVTLSDFQVGSTNEQFGWVLRSGITPVIYSVAATVGKVFGGTSGKATPTPAAGVQILNAQCLIAAVSTFTRQGTTLNGSSKIKVPNDGGLYPGMAVSGTGIPGSSVVSSIDATGTSYVLGSAIDTPASATATGTVTLTYTNTGYGIVQIDRPTFQSQIT
jgi:hypothetical protein